LARESLTSSSGKSGIAAEALCWICFITSIASLAIQPVSADSFWWHLSRGRVVSTGSLSPSRDLLANDTSAEADWLGGLPFYLGYELFGIDGLMISKVMAVLMAGLLLMGCRSPARPWESLLIVVLSLLGAWTAWDPVPLQTEVLLMVLTFLAAESFCRRPDFSRLCNVLMILTLWANIGPGCFLGVLVVWAEVFLRRGPLPGKFGRRPFVIGMVTALGACHLTPQGVYTLWDSFRFVLPHFAASSDVLTLTAWKPLAGGLWKNDFVAFMILWTFSLLCHAVRVDWVRSISVLVFAAAITLFSAPNLPLISIWLGLVTLRAFRELPHFFRMRSGPQWALNTGVAMLLWTHAIVFASGSFPNMEQRLGWGLDPKLETIEFDEAMKPLLSTGTVYCPTILEAGMVSWLSHSGTIANDTQQRALLEGRLENTVKLAASLLDRTDIRNRETTRDWRTLQSEVGGPLIVVAAGNTRLIAALETTPWKPLALDAAVIPFGVVGSAQYAGQIVDTLQLREFVNMGPWAYVPRTSDISHRDLWGELTGTFNHQKSLQLSRVFEAMDLTYAALRAINPSAQQGSTRELRAAFAQYQFKLASYESSLTGHSSLIRSISFDACRTDLKGHSSFPAITKQTEVRESVSFKQVEGAVGRYLAGDVSGAIKLLEGHEPEVLYAKAVLTLESGDPLTAAKILRGLVRQFPENHLSVLSGNLLYLLHEEAEMP
jgi:hypothetical protein